MGLEEIRAMKDAAKLPKAKKVYRIPAKSEKRKAKEKAEIGLKGDSGLDKWFEATRKKLVGVCQCGCARKSSKFEDDHYRASCCHIFPKRTFKSIMLHPLNYVERNFWEGCHSNLDNRSMDLWPNMADWDDIQEKFHHLAPLLTDEERKHKFYTHFEKLIYGTK
jgi:hypothetical protein